MEKLWPLGPITALMLLGIVVWTKACRMRALDEVTEQHAMYVSFSSQPECAFCQIVSH